MERKESTPGRESRRRYEERNRAERKRKSAVFETMIPRELYEEINAFLSEHDLTKVRLVEAGYMTLREKVEAANRTEQRNIKENPSGKSEGVE